jgi:hypothetical protein
MYQENEDQRGISSNCYLDCLREEQKARTGRLKEPRASVREQNSSHRRFILTCTRKTKISGGYPVAVISIVSCREERKARSGRLKKPRASVSNNPSYRSSVLTRNRQEAQEN